MPRWLLLIIVGVLLFGVAYIPLEAIAGWATLAKFVGTVLILFGAAWGLMILLGVPRVPRE